MTQLGYAATTAQVELVVTQHQNPESQIYVYVYSGQIVGFISVIRFFYFPALQTITRITALCVDQQHRSLSIGGKLLQFAEKIAAAAGDHAIEVTCSVRREQAHQFYEQQGYVEQAYRFVKRFDPVE